LEKILTTLQKDRSYQGIVEVIERRRERKTVFTWAEFIQKFSTRENVDGNKKENRKEKKDEKREEGEYEITVCNGTLGNVIYSLNDALVLSKLYESLRTTQAYDLDHLKKATEIVCKSFPEIKQCLMK